MLCARLLQASGYTLQRQAARSQDIGLAPIFSSHFCKLGNASPKAPHIHRPRQRNPFAGRRGGQLYSWVGPLLGGGYTVEIAAGLRHNVTTKTSAPIACWAARTTARWCWCASTPASPPMPMRTPCTRSWARPFCRIWAR
jgi:hypothetical protein